MDLHGIVKGAIGAVNPFVLITVKLSTGYTQSSDGTQVPTYNTINNVSAQIQEKSASDLRQIDALNIQGQSKVIYLNQKLNGIERALQTGGDLVVISGDTYLVTLVPESWPDWCKAIVTQQNGN